MSLPVSNNPSLRLPIRTASEADDQQNPGIQDQPERGGPGTRGATPPSIAGGPRSPARPSSSAAASALEDMRSPSAPGAVAIQTSMLPHRALGQTLVSGGKELTIADYPAEDAMHAVINRKLSADLTRVLKDNTSYNKFSALKRLIGDHRSNIEKSIQQEENIDWVVARKSIVTVLSAAKSFVHDVEMNIKTHIRERTKKEAKERGFTVTSKRIVSRFDEKTVDSIEVMENCLHLYLGMLFVKNSDKNIVASSLNSRNAKEYHTNMNVLNTLHLEYLNDPIMSNRIRWNKQAIAALNHGWYFDELCDGVEEKIKVVSPQVLGIACYHIDESESLTLLESQGPTAYTDDELTELFKTPDTESASDPRRAGPSKKHQKKKRVPPEEKRAVAGNFHIRLGAKALSQVLGDHVGIEHAKYQSRDESWILVQHGWRKQLKRFEKLPELIRDAVLNRAQEGVRLKRLGFITEAKAAAAGGDDVIGINVPRRDEQGELLTDIDRETTDTVAEVTSAGPSERKFRQFDKLLNDPRVHLGKVALFEYYKPANETRQPEEIWTNEICEEWRKKGLLIGLNPQQRAENRRLAKTIRALADDVVQASLADEPAAGPLQGVAGSSDIGNARAG